MQWFDLVELRLNYLLAHVWVEILGILTIICKFSFMSNNSFDRTKHRLLEGNEGKVIKMNWWKKKKWKFLVIFLYSFFVLFSQTQESKFPSFIFFSRKAERKERKGKSIKGKETNKHRVCMNLMVGSTLIFMNSIIHFNLCHNILQIGAVYNSTFFTNRLESRQWVNFGYYSWWRQSIYL